MTYRRSCSLSLAADIVGYSSPVPVGLIGQAATVLLPYRVQGLGLRISGISGRNVRVVEKKEFTHYLDRDPQGLL